MCAGWTLDDVPARLNWRALHAFVAQSALQPATALHRELVGEHYQWGMVEQLLALVVDELAVANWQRSKDGAKGRNRPSPLPRPGVKQKSGERVGGTTALPLSELEALFAAWDAR